MKFLTPSTLDDALAMKADRPDARPMAGGTDLLVGWAEHPDRRSDLYLDLSSVRELRDMTWTDDALTLGARVTYWHTHDDDRIGSELPMMHHAGRQVGAVQIQTRGTWAGNIANASPAADGVPVLMAYDVRVVLASTRGERSVPLDTFYSGYKTMDLASDELITRIEIPRGARHVHRYEKVGSRRAQAITKVGFAATRTDDGWRIVANSVAPTVCRCPAIEARFDSGEPLGSPSELREAISRDVAPIDDIRSTRAYREEVLARMLYWSLRDS